MDASAYLDRILELYASTFDIERPRTVDGICFDAYGFFSSLSERYVLVKDAKLWSVNAFEHAFFRVMDSIEPEDISVAKSLVEGPIQSEFITKGKKYPERDHLHSLITVVLISKRAVGEETAEKARHFRFDRSYLFTLRGYSEGRLIAVDLENKKVHTNKAAAKLRGLYEKAMRRS